MGRFVQAVTMRGCYIFLCLISYVRLDMLDEHLEHLQPPTPHFETQCSQFGCGLITRVRGLELMDGVRILPYNDEQIGVEIDLWSTLRNHWDMESFVRNTIFGGRCQDLQNGILHQKENKICISML